MYLDALDSDPEIWVAYGHEERRRVEVQRRILLRTARAKYLNVETRVRPCLDGRYYLWVSATPIHKEILCQTY